MINNEWESQVLCIWAWGARGPPATPVGWRQLAGEIFFLGGGVGKNGGEGNINNHWAILAVSPPPYPAPQPEPQRGTNAEMAHRWLGGWLAGWEQVFINLNPASLAGPLQG